MLRYYFKLGLRNLRRNPVLTGLMILTLAVGVAASVSTLTILHVMSGNPIPDKSDRLVVPLMDVGRTRDYVPGQDPDDLQMSYPDARNLLEQGPGLRRVAVFGVSPGIESPRNDGTIIDVTGMAASQAYFQMFEVPFRFGAGWTADQEKARARVVVLNRDLSERLFGGASPVGKRVRMYNQSFEVVGVVGDWKPVPRYTHLINGSGGALSGNDEIYIPFATAIDVEAGPSGSLSCHGTRNAGFKGLIESECTWLQFWFELPSAADVPALRSWLTAYSAEQKKLGRHPRQAPVQVFNVMQWMEKVGVVDNDSRAAVWIAFGFLLLCLVNTMGLLLAKFSSRSAEVGVRRALGATRGAVFRQFLVETGVVGLAGGTLGLLLSVGALWVIRQQSQNLSAVARMDWQMLGLTLVLALLASLLAGLLPTWRACQVTPALQLKSQ